MRYSKEFEDGELVLNTFQGSVDLQNESGTIFLDWDEIHWLVEILPKAIEDAKKTYWPE